MLVQNSSAQPQNQEVVVEKKIVILGQTKVGKTTFIKKYVHNDKNYTAKNGTIGAETNKKELDLSDFGCNMRV